LNNKCEGDEINVPKTCQLKNKWGNVDKDNPQTAAMALQKATLGLQVL